MGVSTTGFVLTNTKDVFKMMETIEDTLHRLVKKYASKTEPIFRDDTSSFPRIEYSPVGRCFYAHFKVNNEVRMLQVGFDFDCDYSDYGDSKVIWSLNCWGMAEEIVLAICEEMRQYGRVFYDASDAHDNVVEVYGHH